LTVFRIRTPAVTPGSINHTYQLPFTLSSLCFSEIALYCYQQSIFNQLKLLENIKMNKVIRILILEDRASDADLMEYELMDAGFAFTSKRAMDEKAFLRSLEEFFPDLILSDYDLPQYTGALALAEAKKRFPEVPFLLVTGALDEHEERMDEILAGGASGYILKDRLDQLAPAVHKALWMSRRNS